MKKFIKKKLFFNFLKINLLIFYKKKILRKNLLRKKFFIFFKKYEKTY